MAWTQAKTAIIAGVGILLAAGGTVSVWEYNHSPRFWEHRFASAYGLKPGENVRYFRKPIVSARTDFYHNEPSLSYQVTLIPDPPDIFVFKQTDQDTPGYGTCVFGTGRNSLQAVLALTMGFNRFELDDPKHLMDLQLPGDWTVRSDISREDFFAALEPIIFKATKHRVHFQKETVDRDVIVVSGKLNFDPDDFTDLRHPKTLKLYNTDPKNRYDRMGRGLKNINELLGELLNVMIVDETQAPDSWWWKVNVDAQEFDPQKSAKLENKILNNLSDQTGLTFIHAQRTVELWLVTEQK